KSNLFFAKGLIFVEGISEEIIIPALADKLFELNEIDNSLTSASVSVIPIGNTAFLRYSKIFLRSREPQIDIPISIVNDLDLRPIKYAEKYNILQDKRRANNIITEYNVDDFKNQKKSNIESQSIRAFISNFWTLEYCIALHPTLRKILFKSIVQCIEEIRADNYKGIKESKKGIKPISEIVYETKWENFVLNKNNEQ
ncbi:ATP-dependent endonuclease, partial [Chryseobacterium indologenes]|uniref:ATP-dependent endonuclease n=1 Tax=Chryseobacterium indologenes TaxID=253 RepID=UPI001627B34D